MQLYLVQHGPALTKEQDPARPLSEEGYELVQRSAAHAGRLGIRVREILHSDKLRAAQTAAAFEASLRVPRRETEGLGPNDDVSRLRRDVQTMNDNLMVVGHLPFLVRLAAALLCQDESIPVVAFQQAGIIRLDRDEGGRWSLRWVIPPEIMLEG